MSVHFPCSTSDATKTDFNTCNTMCRCKPSIVRTLLHKCTVNNHRGTPHYETKEASSHVQSDPHEQLDALVTNLVEFRDFLAETSCVVSASGLSRDDLDTSVPVATVCERERGGRERGRERGREGEGEGGREREREGRRGRDRCVCGKG